MPAINNKSTFMKKHFLYLLSFSVLIAFSACKKDAVVNNDNEIATHADDQSRFSAEVDAVANDADIAVESSTTFSGRFQNIQGVICDATIALNTTSDPKTITITYDGTTCPGATRTRTGVVILSMASGVQWKNAGAAIHVTFQNLKITRIIDNKSITINGTQTYTNVSGGLLINLASLGTITHTITSDGLTLTFDDASQRSWKVAKQRVFTFAGTAVITTTGTHTEGTDTHIAEWGTNRFGRAFTTSVSQPLVVRQSCNFRLTSGEVRHTTPAVTATVTFGLDATGTPTSCPAGVYYFKAVWTGASGTSITIIHPY
jgi:hypothetical protein